MMSEIKTIDGGQNKISSLGGPTLKKYLWDNPRLSLSCIKKSKISGVSFFAVFCFNDLF